MIAENVKEVLSGRYSKYQENFCDILESSGYSVEQDVMDLSLYGLPQRRHRAITLASKRGLISIPSPSICTGIRANCKKNDLGSPSNSLGRD